MRIRNIGYLLLVVALAATVLVGCGRRKKATPVPTLANMTVVPITPTLGGFQTTQVLPLPEQGLTPPKPVGETRPRVEVVVEKAPVYMGPGETFVIVASGKAGDQLTVDGRSPDGKWLRVCCFLGRSGWIAVQHVRPLTDISNVPVEGGALQSPLESP